MERRPQRTTMGPGLAFAVFLSLWIALGMTLSSGMAGDASSSPATNAEDAAKKADAAASPADGTGAAKPAAKAADKADDGTIHGIPHAAEMPKPMAPPARYLAPIPPPPGPFGPGYDPLQGPPQEPATKGEGLTSLRVLASGAAEIEELADPDKPAPALFGVLAELDVAAGSTTPRIDVDTVSLDVPADLFAMCLPEAEPPLQLFREGGMEIAHWHVSVSGSNVFCGGRNIRTAVYMKRGSGRITTTGKAAWTGKMLLLFEKPTGDAKTLTLLGRSAPLAMAGAAPADATSPKNEAAPAE